MRIWILPIIILIVVTLTMKLLLFRTNTRFRKINAEYGKPYRAKLIKIIKGYSEVRCGISSIAFHPKGAISFDNKIVRLPQITAVHLDICSNTINDVSLNEERCLSVVVCEEDGEYEVVFTAAALDEIHRQLRHEISNYYLNR